jgi:large subunit ribosomal protein L13
MTQKTFSPKSQAKSDRKWYLIDATDKVVGRVATQIANLLRGKNKTTFSSHLDMGDYVIVLNVEKIRMTGGKEQQKEYIHHTGYVGHLRRKSFQHVQATKPERILKDAVAGMIPRNKLKKFILQKLYIYAGAEHPHAGQSPITFNV